MAHRYGGFSQLLLDSIAIGPIEGQLIMTGSVEEITSATSGNWNIKRGRDPHPILANFPVAVIKYSDKRNVRRSFSGL